VNRTNASVGKVAFLFPGQGTIPDKSPPSSRVGEHLFALAERTGLSLREWLATGSVDLLQRTEFAQPAILIDSLAKAEALRMAGFEPDIVAGHSLGEYAALVVSGVLTPEEAFSVVVERGRLMAGVDGAMAAIVKLPLEEVSSICKQIEPQVVIANYNGPRQAVVSGREEGVNQAVELAQEAGGRGIPLRVSGPFHSPLMGDAQAAFSVEDRVDRVQDPIRSRDFQCERKRGDGTDPVEGASVDTDHCLCTLGRRGGDPGRRGGD